MMEAAKIWNEPNNKSHWEPAVDPDWRLFWEMAICAAEAIATQNPAIARVLGGMSPIDPVFIANMKGRGVWITSTPSRCTGSHSTGICGTSMIGPASSTKSAR